MSASRSVKARALQPVDAASLNVFRLTFGLLLTLELARFFLHGWIDSHFLAPSFLFKYQGFGWVALPPGDRIYWVFGVIGALSIMVALGLFYRLAIVGLFCGFSYVFLLEQANYLNQYYLVLCVLLLLCFLPAERGWSLDSRRRGGDRCRTVPRWTIWALRGQFELMLIFAGLVKLNPDWLSGQPLEIWLGAHGEAPLVGGLLDSPAVALAASYGVVALHLIGAPLLLWRPARLPVFFCYLLFHLANSILFQIGLFPWLTIIGTLIFFEPDWPRRVWSRLSPNRQSHPPEIPRASPASSLPRSSRVVIALLIVQLLVPLRGLLYPGRASWTEEGQWFAWRMKLDDKRCEARLMLRGPDGGLLREVKPGDLLSERQTMLVSGNPDMLVQFAGHIAGDAFAAAQGEGTAVTADVWCALNGRRPQQLVDPLVDLTTLSRGLMHYDWVLPLR